MFGYGRRNVFTDPFYGLGMPLYQLEDQGQFCAPPRTCRGAAHSAGPFDALLAAQQRKAEQQR